MSGGMLVLSNLAGNVPAVLRALGSTFTGNLLLIGSMANLIVAEHAEARGIHLGYWSLSAPASPLR